MIMCLRIKIEMIYQVVSKLAISSVVPDAINEEDFPLYSKHKEDRVMRMSDALELKKITGS